MDKQFTASEVHRLSNRIPRSNDEIADAQEALRAFADLLEAREKAVPVVTRESAINALAHVGQHNGPGRETEARQMLVEGSPAAAHSTQAQPPAASVTDTLAVFEVVSGVEGPCLTISRKADGKPRHEYRLAGPKPWGGGNTTHSFKVHTRELREQIDAIEAALAVQESPNGV